MNENSKTPSRYCYKAFDPLGTRESLEWMALLKKKDPKAIQLELIKCKNDRWHWLRSWVTTENVHAEGNTTFERFPDLPGLFYLTRLWEDNPRLIVPKSRQLLATWLFSCLYLHDSMFFPSRLTFFQSKKEEDANATVERAWGVYQRLPTFFQEWSPAKRTFCNIRFTRQRSRIWAVPEGSEHARQYSCSGYLSDEAAFQIEVDKVMAAIAPTLGEKGRFTCVSSAAASYFEKMAFDKTI